MPSSSLLPLQERRSAPDLRGGTDRQHAGCPFHSDFSDKERPASPISSPSALRRPSSALGLRRVFVDIDGRAKLIEAPDPSRMGDARYALRLANRNITKQLDVPTSVDSTREVAKWVESLSMASEVDPATPGGLDSPDACGAALDGIPHENSGATHTPGNLSFAERLSSESPAGPAFLANAPHRTYSAAFFPPKNSAPFPALLPAFEWSRSVPPIPAEWDSDNGEMDACAANDAAESRNEPFTVSEHDSDTESAYELRALNAEIDYLKQLVSDEIMEGAGVASEGPSTLNEVVTASEDEVGSSDNEGGHFAS